MDVLEQVPAQVDVVGHSRYSDCEAVPSLSAALAGPVAMAGWPAGLARCLNCEAAPSLWVAPVVSVVTAAWHALVAPACVVKQLALY